MPNLLCYGDSNTHGTVPIHDLANRDPRMDAAHRWPGVCAAALGPRWTVVEEGLPGRTTAFPDPVMGDHMDGRAGLKIALGSHGPLDWLTIMLGTNDVKTRFGNTAQGITGGIAALLDIALAPDIQAKHGGFKTLVICPPPVIETGELAGEFFGATEISRGLSPLYQALATARGCAFLDAGAHITVSPVDGIHFGPDMHQTLGQTVAESLLSASKT